MNFTEGTVLTRFTSRVNTTWGSTLVLFAVLQIIYFQTTSFRHRFSKYQLLTGLCYISSKILARLVKYRPSGNPTHISSGEHARIDDD